MRYGGENQSDKVDEALNDLLIAFSHVSFESGGCGCNDFEARQIKNKVRFLLSDERRNTLNEFEDLFHRGRDVESILIELK